MQIRDKGIIADGFHVLGHPAVPSYLLDGEVPALFDAGVAALSEHYIKDALAVLGDRQPRYLFLTHSHFDHVGAASALKKQWPGLTIAASAATARIMAKPSAVELMKKLSRETYDSFTNWGVKSLSPEPFEPFEVDLTVQDGDVIELGSGPSVRVMASPGHTWDFLIYWLPKPGILISSESSGTQKGQGSVTPDFLVDFDAYRESLKKMASLKPQVLCTGHHMVLTQEDVELFLAKSLTDLDAYADMVVGFLQEEDGDVDRAAARVKQVEWDPKPLPKQPLGAYMLNTRARVQTLKKRMEKMQGPADQLLRDQAQAP